LFYLQDGTSRLQTIYVAWYLADSPLLEAADQADLGSPLWYKSCLSWWPHMKTQVHIFLAIR
jgi:hypothetical protein